VAITIQGGCSASKHWEGWGGIFKGMPKDEIKFRRGRLIIGLMTKDSGPGKTNGRGPGRAQALLFGGHPYKSGESSNSEQVGRTMHKG